MEALVNSSEALHVGPSVVSASYMLCGVALGYVAADRQTSRIIRIMVAAGSLWAIGWLWCATV
jgi:hypothetical protein